MPNSTELLQEILQNPEETRKAYRSTQIPFQDLRALAEHLEHKEVQLFLASYRETPSSIIERIYRNPADSEVVLCLANHPNLSREHLLEYVQSDNVPLRKSIAASRALSPQIAKQLANDTDPFVRETLARNSVIQTSVQRILVDDEIPFVRTALLLSPKMQLEEDFRVSLADDLDPVVRFAAITSQKTGDETLLECADTDEEFTQAALLTRQSLPQLVLESLSLSPNDNIKRAALRQKSLAPDELLGFANDEDVETRVRIAQTNPLPEIVQKQLVQDKEQSVLLKLAENPSLQEDIAEALFSKGDTSLLLRLCANPAVPSTMLLEQAQSGNRTILKFLAEHTTIQGILDIIYALNDEEILYHLAFRKTPATGMPQELLYRFGQNELPTFRQMVAAMEEVPVLLQAQLARDDSLAVRLAMAKNKAIQRVLLERLANDQNPKVKNAAAETLKLISAEETTNSI